jgi:hypothetical protein
MAAVLTGPNWTLPLAIPIKNKKMCILWMLFYFKKSSVMRLGPAGKVLLAVAETIGKRTASS